MNTRIIFVFGLAVILAHGEAFAAKARQSRGASRSTKQAQGTVTESDPEQFKYEQAKARAKQDAEVRALKTKSDQAVSEEEARQTSIAYNRALFQKMRQIDSSLSEHIDLVEAAILRRINP